MRVNPLIHVRKQVLCPVMERQRTPPRIYLEIGSRRQRHVPAFGLGRLERPCAWGLIVEDGPRGIVPVEPAVEVERDAAVGRGDAGGLDRAGFVASVRRDIQRLDLLPRIHIPGHHVDSGLPLPIVLQAQMFEYFARAVFVVVFNVHQVACGVHLGDNLGVAIVELVTYEACAGDVRLRVELGHGLFPNKGGLQPFVLAVVAIILRVARLEFRHAADRLNRFAHWMTPAGTRPNVRPPPRAATVPRLI